MYGPDVKRQGSFAYNCLMARRLVERGVRFVQLMHAGWDHHRNLATQLEIQCRDTDQPSAALVKDLKQRGLLDDTLVIWGGEFGRTPFCQGDINDRKTLGRDHHPYCFTIWMAGGGMKPGFSYGASDDFAYNVGERSRPRPRFPGDGPAPPGHRPRAADIQISGPLLPPDRRAWRSRPSDSRLTSTRSARRLRE